MVREPFTRGEHTYGIMAALVEFGQTTRGFIYVPGRSRVTAANQTPSGEFMIVARRGQGCFLNGHQVLLEIRPRLLSAARVSFACRNQHKGFEAILAEAVPGYLPRCNAAFDYATLLRGPLDAIFYSEGSTPTGEGRCPPWDHAAGVLSVQEAGGYAALPYRPDGVAYAPRRRYHQLLIASNQELWSRMYDHITAVVPDLTRPPTEDRERLKLA